MWVMFVNSMLVSTEDSLTQLEGVSILNQFLSSSSPGSHGISQYNI